MGQITKHNVLWEMRILGWKERIMSVRLKDGSLYPGESVFADSERDRVRELVYMLMG
jgi:hypothetical protein